MVSTDIVLVHRVFSLYQQSVQDSSPMTLCYFQSILLLCQIIPQPDILRPIVLCPEFIINEHRLNPLIVTLVTRDALFLSLWPLPSQAAMNGMISFLINIYFHLLFENYCATNL